MTNLEPLRVRRSVLRRQTLLLLAERSEGENLDAGLLALVANVQTALVAVEEMTEAERPPANQASGRGGVSVSNLGTNVEHMDRRYLWRISKRGHRVHIENPETERAYCQVENCGGKPFDGRGAEIPPGRRLCGNCTDLAGRDRTDYQEPSLAVLLGERLAETEPELFTSTVAPERTDLTLVHRGPKLKRGKQARSAHRSKWGKPKRSMKYARPFDDDLPW